MLDKTKNYKIDVSTLATAEEIKLQEELFKQGYKWHMAGKEIQSSAYKYYFLYDNGDITHSDKYFFDKSDHTLITVPDIMPQPEERTLRDWFAGLAMQRLIDTLSLKDVVPLSFEYADAMLKERNK